MESAGVRLKGQLKGKQSYNFPMVDFTASAFLKYILFMCYMSINIYCNALMVYKSVMQFYNSDKKLLLWMLSVYAHMHHF